MKNIPTATQQKNIAKFSAMWAAGDMVSCKESYTAARRYLDAFRDWLRENMAIQYDCLVGVIEYTNFHELANYSVKNWKL